ncbi:exported hypothetical protein [Candidatus Defluviicoccus seviourii]|uniref:Uncharacterized protein n=1 Tax=Candidatus Defluviicoccus seviourii TaxID=2565273 RepID=A0A564WED9_9PROT|nr:exported hypothetical protein [Candidatus Defluviicoccus seviourii]
MGSPTASANSPSPPTRAPAATPMPMAWSSSSRTPRLTASWAATSLARKRATSSRRWSQRWSSAARPRTWRAPATAIPAFRKRSRRRRWPSPAAPSISEMEDAGPLTSSPRSGQQAQPIGPHLERFLEGNTSILRKTIFSVLVLIAVLSEDRVAHADHFLSQNELNTIDKLKNLRKCSLTKLCPTTVQITGKQFAVSSVDLNNDGNMEISLKATGLDYCGSGGCATTLLQLAGGKWQPIFEGYNIIVLKTMTRGYHDIVLGFRGKDFKGFDQPTQAYCWNGRKYEGCYFVEAK